MHGILFHIFMHLYKYKSLSREFKCKTQIINSPKNVTQKVVKVLDESQFLR